VNSKYVPEAIIPNTRVFLSIKRIRTKCKYNVSYCFLTDYVYISFPAYAWERMTDLGLDFLSSFLIDFRIVNATRAPTKPGWRVVLTCARVAPGCPQDTRPPSDACLLPAKKPNRG
jgi:hypothetical protein